MSNCANKGEWSELYAFIKLLKEGRIYAADEEVNKLSDIYFPIIKIIREEVAEQKIDYCPGEKIRIFSNGELLDEFIADDLGNHVEMLYDKIFIGSKTVSGNGAFEITEANEVIKKLHITKVKAPSTEKIDMTMQIHDINTGYSPVVGFSVKSDMGNPPTLLNAGKNTRFKYEIFGIDDFDMEQINAIGKDVVKEYMVLRMTKLFAIADSITFFSMKDATFEDNLIMIDSNLPVIYGEMILNHYKFIEQKVYDCETLCNILMVQNPVKYRKEHIYRYKIKKLLCASALGMTPGKEWNGLDTATGGYIIIKKDGDVLCYHLYNRNYFEEYLIKNTCFDRPSASRHNYGFIYKENGRYYIDLNVQIRFKSISAASKPRKEEQTERILAYAKQLQR